MNALRCAVAHDPIIIMSNGPVPRYAASEHALAYASACCGLSEDAPASPPGRGWGESPRPPGGAGPIYSTVLIPNFPSSHRTGVIHRIPTGREVVPSKKISPRPEGLGLFVCQLTYTWWTADGRPEIWPAGRVRGIYRRVQSLHPWWVGGLINSAICGWERGRSSCSHRRMSHRIYVGGVPSGASRRRACSRRTPC